MIEVLMIVMGSKEDHSKLESSISMEKDINTDYARTNLDLDNRDSDVDFVKILRLSKTAETFQKQLEEQGGKVHRVMMTAVCDKVSK